MVEQNGVNQDIREKKLTTRITGMIILGILSLTTLIGLFWGKEGLLFVGIIILGITAILFMMIITSGW